METIDYQKKANDFLEKHNITFSAEFIENKKYFEEDKETRDVYNVTFKRGHKSLLLNFGQSIKKSGFYYTKGRQHTVIDRRYLGKTKHELISILRSLDWDFLRAERDTIHYPVAPTPYDVLACLTVCPVGEFEDFCSEYGYDTDRRKAYKTYEAVREEWAKVNNFFTGQEIEEMQEIK